MTVMATRNRALLDAAMRLPDCDGNVWHAPTSFPGAPLNLFATAYWHDGAATDLTLVLNVTRLRGNATIYVYAQPSAAAGDPARVAVAEVPAALGELKVGVGREFVEKLGFAEPHLALSHTVTGEICYSAFLQGARQ